MIHSIKILSLSSRTEEELASDLGRSGVSPEGVRIMAGKGIILPLKIFRVPVTEANILKQEMLSLGADAAVSSGTVDHSAVYTDLILLGTGKTYLELVSRIRRHNFRFLTALAAELESFPDQRIRIFKVGEKQYELGRRYLMGILNLTPDSFYAGSRLKSIDEALGRADRMAEDGADFLDLGAESTRPGADSVSAEDELSRLLPLVRALKKRKVPPLSIDTYKSAVAAACLSEGAEIVNDISGLDFDAKMAEIVAESGATVCLMHIKGTPKDMQKNPLYHDLISEVYTELSRKKERALQAGIEPERIMLDPGIGFGKSVSDNFVLIRRLSEFRSLRCPLLLGLSRKSFIGATIGGKPPEQRLNGSTVLHTLGVLGGADILRVHDVAEAKETLLLFNAWQEGYDYP
ncbi:MAG: dihydropteroate synthase [Candidatus Wallbacteria bacterium]|nr:dihydropteroate synthase [Candidatus Wallbacteria bacterium]